MKKYLYLGGGGRGEVGLGGKLSCLGGEASPMPPHPLPPYGACAVIIKTACYDWRLAEVQSHIICVPHYCIPLEQVVYRDPFLLFPLGKGSAHETNFFS